MKNEGWIEEPLYTNICRIMPIACVDLLVMHEGKLLLMKRNNSPGRGQWFTPGGRIIRGESFEEAVKRILTKETGLKPENVELKGVMSHIWPEVHTVTVIHRVDVSNDQVTLNPEHEDFKWITETSRELHDYVKDMIRIGGILNKGDHP